MPIYPWVDNKSKKEVAVIRDFLQYEDPPTPEEAAAEAKMSAEEYADANWERLIGLSHWTRGQWSGGKGHW